MRIEQGLINDRWPLAMPDFRVEFHAERPKWELGRLADAFDRLRPGMRVFDVGAEHGDFTALYRTWVGPDVIPVEPSTPYWPCMRHTFEANNMGPPPAWFAGFAADTTARLGVDYGENGWPSMADGAVRADPGFQHLAQGDHLARITLDDLSRLVGLPDVIMMDIEGAEWHALLGCRDLLRYKPVLAYISVHEPTMLDWYGKTLEDLHVLMDDVGYTGELLPGHGEIETFWLYTRSA